MTILLRETRYVDLAAILLVGLGAIVGQARGDAIVVTKAMQASTIAEIFINRQGVRVELEIAPADMEVFQDLLPDQLYEALGNGSMPLAERSQRFFRHGLVLRDQNGEPLAGAIQQLEICRRMARDEVTGAPLPKQPVDAELILSVVLRYVFDDQPTSLTIRPQLVADGRVDAANMGFVCYHERLPVNDFRYMHGEVTLDLDWADPWYSRFRHPNLRRQFDAPMSAYLYIEPYEVRKEIILRPKDLLAWLDLGIGNSDVIPIERQAELKDRVAEFLSAKNPVTIDGRMAEGRLDRIHFINRTLITTGIIEPPVELDATSATLGVIFVYPIDRLPDDVSMTWELFGPKFQEIPTVASDEAGGLPSRVTPDDPVLQWRNFLTNPTNPQPMTVAQPPSRREFAIPMITVICGGGLVALLALLARQRKTRCAVSRCLVGASIAVFLTGLIALPIARLVVANPFAESPSLTDDDARELIGSLLHNVYRAFDHHNDSLIYDRLSNSIAGGLLSDVYLETRKSMEVKNQGGLRISVKEVTVNELELVGQAEHSEFTFRCRWRVAGWIGHWGHVHRRMNEHLAMLTIAPRNGRWKITAIEMLDEQPVDTRQTVAASG